MKRMTTISAVLIMAAVLSGCQSSNDDKVNIATLDPEKIVNTSRNTYEYMITFSDIASLAEESEQIIYGEVISMEYIARKNGLCSTTAEVKVLESVKGDCHKGDIIKVSAQQGLVSVQDYIDSMDPEFREEARAEYQQYSDDELNDIYIQQISLGDIMLETGQKNLYFLCESTRYDTEHTYCRIAGPENQFVEVSDGKFMNTRAIGSLLSGDYCLDSSTESVLDTERAASIPSYTLEELVEQMEL